MQSLGLQCIPADFYVKGTQMQVLIHFSTIFWGRGGCASNRLDRGFSVPDFAARTQKRVLKVNFFINSLLFLGRWRGQKSGFQGVGTVGKLNFQAVIKTAASTASRKKERAARPVHRAQAGPMAFPLPNPSGEAALAAILTTA